jgi:hypothetical protein
MSKVNIPITKGDATLEVDTDSLPQAVYEYAFLLGMKTLLNRGMTDVTKAKMPDEAKRKEEAMAIAAKQLEAVYAGKVRMTGGVKAKAASGEVQTEAVRLASIIVKDTIKADGGKVSHYDKKEITKAAKDYIAADPSILEQAKANIEARKELKPKVAIDIKKIAISAKRVADAEEKKAEARAKTAEKNKGKPLSATQAGKSAPRAVPGKGKAKAPVQHA